MKIIVSARVTLGPTKFGYQDFYTGYIRGLSRLGHEVYLFQQVDPSRECYGADLKPVSFENWNGKEFFERRTKSLGIWPRSCLLTTTDDTTVGMSLTSAEEVAREADVLLNFDGCLRNLEGFDDIPFRAYIDLNPGKTMVYKAEYGVDPGLDLHNLFFTFGLNIGTAECEIPTLGLEWKKTIVPLLMSDWPVHADSRDLFTTITSWSGRATYEFKGKYSGEKVDEWRRFLEFPKHTKQPLELAVDIESGYVAELESFREKGWFLVDTNQFRSFQDYRSYISSSRAEFSPAHGPYVQFNVGLCGDRTSRYLSSGKPALVQSTGIEHHLPTGNGLLTFSSIEEAADGIDRINKDYLSHCKAARALAEEFFDSDKVLTNMLQQIGV